ncbi:MAG: hypothetical protein MJ185_05280 [Treponema sp.]|nr:hypothetical protein [Treponema sp.]
MKKLRSFLSFILILILCFISAFVIVWPLWKFATTNARAYTITVLCIAAIWIIFLCIRKIRNKIKKTDEK